MKINECFDNWNGFARYIKTTQIFCETLRYHKDHANALLFSVVLGLSQRGLCLNSARRANRTTFMRNKQLWSTVLLVLDMIKISSWHVAVKRTYCLGICITKTVSPFVVHGHRLIYQQQRQKTRKSVSLVVAMQKTDAYCDKWDKEAKRDSQLPMSLKQSHIPDCQSRLGCGCCVMTVVVDVTYLGCWTTTVDAGGGA